MASSACPTSHRAGWSDDWQSAAYPLERACEEDFSWRSTNTPGLCFASDFFAESLQLTCAGAPIYQPNTKRLVGTLNLTCRYSDTSPIMLSWVCEVAAQIEQAFATMAHRHEQLLFQSFLADNRDSRHAVVCLDEKTIISNAAAARLIGPSDQSTLWEFAARSLDAGDTPGTTTNTTVSLAGGATVDVDVLPVTDGSTTVGALVRLKMATHSSRGETATGPSTPLGNLVGVSPAWRAMCRAVTDNSSRALLLTGEPGVGKFAVASTLADASQTVVVDAVARRTSGTEWAQILNEAIDAEPELLIVRHIDELGFDGLRATASAVAAARSAGVRVVATTSASPTRLSQIVEWFDRIVEVPSVADRQGDLPLLLEAVSNACTPRGMRVHWMPDAIQALDRVRWERNVGELESLVRELVAAGNRQYVNAQDLPINYRVQATRRQLQGLEQIEAKAIMSALRDAGGNKRAAADQLGIARSTLYRKVRSLGINIESTNF